MAPLHGLLPCPVLLLPGISWEHLCSESLIHNPGLTAAGHPSKTALRACLTFRLSSICEWGPHTACCQGRTALPFTFLGPLFLPVKWEAVARLSERSL